VRAADLSSFSGTTTVGDVELSMSLRRGSTGTELVVDGTGFDQAIITSELVELCMWTPIAVEDMRRALVDEARSLVTDYRAVHGEGTSLAEGDRAYYGTVFRGATFADPKTDQPNLAKMLVIGRRR